MRPDVRKSDATEAEIMWRRRSGKTTWIAVDSTNVTSSSSPSSASSSSPSSESVDGTCRKARRTRITEVPAEVPDSGMVDCEIKSEIKIAASSTDGAQLVPAALFCVAAFRSGT